MLTGFAHADLLSFLPNSEGAWFWALAQNSSLQRFEIQFDHIFTPGDFGHVDHDLEIDFAALREHECKVFASAKRT